MILRIMNILILILHIWICWFWGNIVYIQYTRIAVCCFEFKWLSGYLVIWLSGWEINEQLLSKEIMLVDGESRGSLQFNAIKQEFDHWSLISCDCYAFLNSFTKDWPATSILPFCHHTIQTTKPSPNIQNIFQL